MDKLTVTLKTVTPMFLGGASPDVTAELRAPSIKGALRFWYRAIDPLYNQKVKPADPKSPTWEEKIFGSTEHGQGCFFIKIMNAPICKGKAEDDRWDKKKKTAYLGYGPIARNKEKKQFLTTRGWCESRNTFIVLINFRKNLQSEIKNKVERSLWALAVFGGLGSRSRRGFGSLVVEKIDGVNSDLPPLNFKEPKEIRNAIEIFFKGLDLPNDLPIYTSWSKKSRCLVTKDKMTPDDVMEWIGSFMHNCRSYRSKNLNRLSCVDNDHNIMCDYLKKGDIKELPQRTSFGLPHNYFFTECVHQKNAEINLTEGEQKGRRASPLFIHVQGLAEENNACVVVSFLPATFIPTGKRIKVSGDNQDSKEVDFNGDFSAVIEFMNKMASQSLEVSL